MQDVCTGERFGDKTNFEAASRAGAMCRDGLYNKGLGGTNNLTGFFDDMKSCQRVAWRGFLFVDPEAAVLTGKKAKIIIGYHTRDNPAEKRAFPLEFILP